MRKLLYILILVCLSCEKVVVIPLPQEQNLLMVEGWLTDNVERQNIRLTRSNSFSGDVNPTVENAAVSVQIRSGGSFPYTHSTNGNYISDTPFAGINGEEYRVFVTLDDGDVIRSEWTLMPRQTEIVLLSVGDFEENDPNNPGTTITVFFPRITARDSADFANYYRWVFYKNDVRLTEPESITLQNDRFFDGNFIPNLFDEFEYAAGDEIKVELHSINKDAHDFLSLLKSQITTLGAAASTTPATVEGNLENLNDPDETILGFFSATAVNADSVVAEN